MDFPAGFENVFERLEVVEQRGRWWTARCPAHEDRTPSLSVGVTEDGEALILKCWARCTNEEVMQAAGIQPSELFRGNGKPVRRKLVKAYDYRDEKGVLRYQNCRMEPKTFIQRRPDGNRHWIWGLGVGEYYQSKNGDWYKTPKGEYVQKREYPECARLLYRLPELVANPTAAVCVLEGEKDVDRIRTVLRSKKILATTVGAAKYWRDEFTRYFRNRNVAIIPDNDPPGKLLALTVGASLLYHDAPQSVRFVELPGLKEHGDVSDWLDMGHTRDELIATINAAREWK